MMNSSNDMPTAKQFQEIIEHHLGRRVWNKIEEIIKIQYNITIDEAIADYPKFHAALRILFGNGAEGLKKISFQLCIKSDLK